MPLPTDDPKVRQPDITQAQKALGWEPRVSLAEGLEITIRYFRELAEQGRLSVPPVLTVDESVDPA